MANSKYRKYIQLKCSVCGKEMSVRTDYADKHSGLCRSCKSMGNKNAVRHGESRSRLHDIWLGLKHRRYKTYIPCVCEEWLTYENFRDWAISNGYDDNLTIDRIDPHGNYEPSNCQWITLEENARKDKRIFNDRQKDAIYVFRKFLGLTQKEMASALNVSRNTILRIEREVKNDAI